MAEKTVKPERVNKKHWTGGIEAVRKAGSSRVELAYKQITEWIVRGDLQPGHSISEFAIADRLGVSRTPVREALRILAEEGLVEVFPNKGAFVSRIGLRDIRELFQVREAIEGMAARLAARRVSTAQVRQFQEQLQQAEAVRDPKERLLRMEDAGNSLHAFVLAACGNNRIKSVIDNYSSLLRLEQLRAAVIPGRIEKSFGEHQRILEALAAGDDASCEKAMRDHIRGTLESLLRTDENPG